MASDAELRELMNSIASAQVATSIDILTKSPALAVAALKTGATRASATSHFLSEIAHYVYAGDTALHVAAAAYDLELARRLIAHGADISARNRRGASPLHYAADGNPASRAWEPARQAAMVKLLIDAGGDPNAADKSGVTALHRAIRNRCAPAVRALLNGGADAQRANAQGSTPMMLAQQTTGRSGSGSSEAKAQQAEILERLRRGDR